jgi:type II secretory pathway component PulF
MPVFIYKAKDGLETCVDGSIQAESLEIAVKKIIQTGLNPLEVLPQTRLSIQKKKKVGLNDQVIFFKQLSDLIEAKISLLKALQLSSKSIRSLYFKQTIEDIHAAVKDGVSFSEALLVYPHLFAKMHIHMIQAGEMSGRLDEALKRVATFLENEHQAKTKITLSLIYPAFVFLISSLVIAVLLTVVIPKIMVMYDDVSESLPMPTLILMAISHLMTSYWWVLGGIVVLGLWYVKKLTSSAGGKRQMDRYVLQLPLVGPLIKDIELGRFARVMASLLESGVVMISALASAQEILENEVLKEEIKKVKEDVIEGSSLTNALKVRSVHVSETEINLIMPAEEAGRITQGLSKLAQVCEAKVDLKIKTVLALVEPVIILSLGLMVGFILIAALLPILNMNMIVK